MIGLNQPITEESVKQLRKQWTDALRSGKYQQGAGRLRSEHNTYCCLGVLCEVLGLKHAAFNEGVGYEHPLGDQTKYLTSTLSTQVSQQAGLYQLYIKASSLSSNGERSAEWHLMKRNDDGVPFREIADFIDTLPIKLPE